MATVINISLADGYPTSDAVRVSVSFTVTYAGSYYTYFEVEEDYTGNVVATDFGNTYSMSANASKSGLIKTIYGLTSSTAYTITAYLYNASTGTPLDINPSSIPFTTDDPPLVSTAYYARLILDANGGASPGGYTESILDEWNGAWGSSCDISFTYDGSVFSRSGYSLLGFSTSASSTSASYGVQDTYIITATSTSESNPTTRRLYAVWKASANRPSNWYWSGQVTVGGTTYSAPMVSGGEVPVIQGSNGNYNAYYIGATEWNNFVTRVNAFRTYLGYVTISPPRATAGYQMSVSCIQPVIAAINEIAGSSIPYAYANDKLSASLFTRLSNTLNNIP